MCNSLKHAIAVFTYNDKNKTSADCVCFESLRKNVNEVADAEKPEDCVNKLFVTSWGLTQCTYAKFLEPNQTRVPQVGLITVPGSGNTWTRSVVQGAIGILSGSVYRSQPALDQNLFGEMEPWNSGRTTLIKSHQFNTDPKDFLDYMDKMIITLRNPLKSAVAEFNRQTNENASLADALSFMEKSANPKTVKQTEFTKHFEYQLSHLKKLVTQYTNSTLPVLFISYEDLKDNLLAQLLRIANFMNLGDDENILERSVCTVLRQSATINLTKRDYKVEFAQKVGTVIDKTRAIRVLQEIDKIFRSSKTYEMGTEEYASVIQQHKWDH